MNRTVINEISRWKALSGKSVYIAGNPELIREYGLPQEWNCDGRLGPERYIQVQVWDDEPIKLTGYGGMNRD